MSGEPLRSARSWHSPCISPSFPSVNVKGNPKKEAFDKASQAQLHQFCYVSALGGHSYRKPDTLPYQDGGLDLTIGRQGQNLQLPASTVGGLLMGCGGLWRQHQLLKAGRPPEKGLLETLFTSSKFYPGQGGRHTFLWNLNITSESLKSSVSSWTLPLGWEKTRVPQRPDN